MMASQNTRLNPVLEELRSKALNSVGNMHLNDEIEDIIRVTNRIHASFLFYSLKTLQALLRTLGETNGTATEIGWQSFGDKLGLNMSILKVINNNHFNDEGPVYNILLCYVQYQDATIGKIIQVLQDMKRFDVIARTKKLILELTEVVLELEHDLMGASNTSDYGSSESNEASGEHLSETIIKPDVIPEAPLVLKNVQEVPLISTHLLKGVTFSRTNVISSPVFSQSFQSETLLQAAPSTPSSNFSTSQNTGSTDTPTTAKPKIPYSKKVLLTFSEDGAGFAAEIARVLRQQRGCQRIGVLILEEQLRHLQPDPNLFISASIQLVDYVIPILTEGYLRAVLRQIKISPGTNNCIDAKYVPYIYQIMVQDYTKRGCLNDKVRCLIPDEQIDKVLSHLIMIGPLFSAWEKLSRTDILAERILATNV